jgi:hypothetical protein
MGNQDHLYGAGVTGGRARAGRQRLYGAARHAYSAARRGYLTARHWYGARPLHLLALLAAFCLAGYAFRAVIAAGQWRGFALWFAVAIVAHDLLLFPLYSLADLSLRRLLPLGGRKPPRMSLTRPARDTDTQPPRTPGRAAGLAPAAAQPRPDPGRTAGRAAGSPALAGPPAVNYVRVPVAFSLLLLLVWFPLILGLSAGTYHRASGLSTGPYLWRWLGVTGVLFAASAAAYALRLRRSASRPPHLPRRSRRVRPRAGRGG